MPIFRLSKTSIGVGNVARHLPSILELITRECARTWEGFDAEWVKNMPKPAKRTTIDAEKERKAAELRKEYEERAKRFESANDESDLLAAIGG